MRGIDWRVRIVLCGSDGLDGGWDDGRTLLLYYLGGPFLGSFSVNGGFSICRSRLGFVDSVNKSSAVVSVWLLAAWPDWTGVCKLAAICSFFAPISN